MHPGFGFETVTIASLYWEDLVAETHLVTIDSDRKCTPFVLPKAKDRNTPSTLVIYPRKEWRDIGMGQRQLVVDEATSARVIAEDLIRRWALNRPFADIGRPAVWICEGTEPTQEEIDENLRLQIAWCKAGCDTAEAQWRVHDYEEVKMRLKLYKAMAEYIGASDYEWAKGPNIAGFKNCPVCGTQVGASAMRCQNCHEIIDAAAYKKWRDEQDRVLASAAPAPAPPPLPKSGVAVPPVALHK